MCHQKFGIMAHQDRKSGKYTLYLNSYLPSFDNSDEREKDVGQITDTHRN